jgi:hypothetical protein
MPAALAKLCKELPDGAVVVDYVGPIVMGHQPHSHSGCQQDQSQGDQNKSQLPGLHLVAQVCAPTSWNPSQTFYVWRLAKK